MQPVSRSTRRLCLSLLVFLALLLACNMPAGTSPAGSNQPAGLPPAQVPSPTVLLDDIDRQFNALEVTPSEPVALDAGPGKPILSADVGSEGGRLEISGTGSTLDGLALSIPPNAYPEPVHFEVESAAINALNLGAGITPITPLLRIDNGGVMAAEWLEISLPLSLSQGEFAMLFTYDAQADMLDALPLVEEDATHLVALTRHFTDIMGVKIDTAALDELKIQTGFRQGVNNWQFVNEGSYLSPGGICMGMTLTALEFYLRSDGAPLYGLYDAYNNPVNPTPATTLDDRLAIRLASLAQMDSEWDNESQKFWFKVQNTGSDWIAYYSFALALRAHAEPQFVAITEPGGGGHAMIIYGKYADRFYVSDPNYPNANANRSIVFDRSSGKFQPYMSGPNAHDLGTAYTTIRYLNRYSFFTPLKFGSLWEAFDAGTVGDGRFPAYTLDVSSSSDPSALPVVMDRYDVYIAGPDLDVVLASSASVSMLVYDKSNVQAADDRGSGVVTLPLPDPNGTPYLFAISGDVSGSKSWIDGRWFNFIQPFDGAWHGAACDESESHPFRWLLNLTQDQGGYVTGTVLFHACPGGGQADYDLSGQYQPGENLVRLSGTMSGGRGDLGSNSAASIEFTFDRSGVLAPNLAP